MDGCICVYNFTNGISLKVNAIAHPGFELAYYDVAVYNVSHYTSLMVLMSQMIFKANHSDLEWQHLKESYLWIK